MKRDRPRLCVRVGAAAAVEQILRVNGLIHTFDVVETEDPPAIQPLPEGFTQAISG
ncbi:MAG: hypothetical protein LH654_15210 [Thermoleophilia bacterium]|nr:hypothetical protein [Thermoleophilia bacterium]